MSKKLKIKARLVPDGEQFALSGQEARTLLTLNAKRMSGVTVFDFQGGVGYRLAAYIQNLVKYRHINIDMVREKHDGGWHGRWFIKSAIEIISVDDPAKLAMHEVPA